jgi:hypothetical protein
MIIGITITAGIILVAGICNNVATLPEIITCTIIGYVLMALPVLFARHTYYLKFKTFDGRIKKVRVNNFASKLIAIRKYNKLGYTLQEEWEMA